MAVPVAEEGCRSMCSGPEAVAVDVGGAWPSNDKMVASPKFLSPPHQIR